MYPQLVELQQQLEHQLGKRVELSRYIGFFCGTTNYFIASLLAGAEALYQRRGLAAQVKEFQKNI